MLEKVIHYAAPVPERVVYLTAGIDSQRNRYEMYVWGWAPGEEAFLIDKQIIMGRHDDEDTLQRVDAVINKNIVMLTGRIFPFPVSAGISAVSMQKSSINAQKHGIFRVLPVKGASVYGKPVITMPKNATRAGYSCAKSVLILPKKCFTLEWGGYCACRRSHALCDPLSG